MLILLTALAQRPAEWRHEHDLMKQTGLLSGTLYPLLMRMTDDGLVEGERREPERTGRPARRAYRLTAQEIIDFATGVDKIDVSAIDPSDQRGDQALTFIGDAAFTGRGGADIEVRAEAIGRNLFEVQLDTDHNGRAEYTFQVHATALTANDVTL